MQQQPNSRQRQDSKQCLCLLIVTVIVIVIATVTVIVITCSNDNPQVTTAEQDLHDLAILQTASAMVHRDATPQCPHQKGIFIHAFGSQLNQVLQLVS